MIGSANPAVDFFRTLFSRELLRRRWRRWSAGKSALIPGRRKVICGRGGLFRLTSRVGASHANGLDNVEAAPEKKRRGTFARRRRRSGR
jgi:hypothetical protein